MTFDEKKMLFSGQMECLQKIYFLLLVVVKGRGAVSDCREHLARPERRLHPWMVSSTILLPLNFEPVYRLIIFPPPPNCCLTYLEHLTFGHFDTFVVTTKGLSLGDQGGLKICLFSRT